MKIGAESASKTSSVFIQTLAWCMVGLVAATAWWGGAVYAQGEEEKVALKIELPEPSFEGTPLDYFGRNLEKRSFKPRSDAMVPKGTTLLSKGKPVTAGAKPAYGKLEYVTNGDKNYSVRSIIELPAGVQYIQVDLEDSYEIYVVMVWHYHRSERVYFDIVVKVSDDAEFASGVTAVYNNDHNNTSGLGIGSDKEYVETNEGRLIEAHGAKGRYVRIYSNGNTTDDTNHYIEVEVYGKLAD